MGFDRIVRSMPIYQNGKHDGKKEGYEQASKEYEEKFRKQAEEFEAQKQALERQRDKFEERIDALEKGKGKKPIMGRLFGSTSD